MKENSLVAKKAEIKKSYRKPCSFYDDVNVKHPTAEANIGKAFSDIFEVITELRRTETKVETATSVTARWFEDYLMKPEGSWRKYDRGSKCFSYLKISQ